MNGEREADVFNRRDPRTGGVSKSDRGSWQGIPGGAEYRHITRVGENRRIDNLIGPNGKALATKEFTWAQLSETVFDELRKAEIEKRIEQRTKEAGEQGGKISVEDHVKMRHEVTSEVEKMFKDSKELNIFSNTLKAYQSRLEIVTGEMPEIFQNIAGVKGADGYLLISGTRTDNEEKIFRNFERLGNAGGNIKPDRIFSHRGGVIEGHGDKDFFGWKVTIEGRVFVFIWNPSKDELADKGEKLDIGEEGIEEAGVGEEGVDVVDSDERQKL